MTAYGGRVREEGEVNRTLLENAGVKIDVTPE
jgi:hypothetical protein